LVVVRLKPNIGKNHAEWLLCIDDRIVYKALKSRTLDVGHGCTYDVHMIKFEWNRAKAASNLKKHGVSFEEAQSVFYDEFAIQFFDEDSESEDRFLMLGMSNEARILLVCHCERHGGGTIRIISARKATSNERKHYTVE
jgi:uncharacterized DUF497 family protein